MANKNRTSFGFTALEPLAVMVAIALLASYVVSRFSSQIGLSQPHAGQALIAAFSKALVAWRVEVGQSTVTEQGRAAQSAQPEGPTRRDAPYLSKPPCNVRWSQPAPSKHSDYDLFSLGKDGWLSGSGKAANITSW